MTKQQNSSNSIIASRQSKDKEKYIYENNDPNNVTKHTNCTPPLSLSLSLSVSLSLSLSDLKKVRTENAS
jgi:hypothetical protein